MKTLYRSILSNSFVLALLLTGCDSGSADPGPDPLPDPGPENVVAPRVSGVSAIDNTDGTLAVSFVPASDASKIGEYRVIVVPVAVASGFDLAAAGGLAAGRYVSVAPASSPNLILTAQNQDSEGAALSLGASYRVFVLSVADGVNAGVNALSAPSSPAIPTLVIRAASRVATVALDDVTNNGNGSDLQVVFGPGSDESTISEYRIIVVPSEEAAAFELEAAESVIAGRYTSVSKTGSGQDLVLGAAATDNGGAQISDSRSYSAFVLSIADGVVAGINTLSPASNAVTVAVTTVKVTYMGNDGVLVSDGDKSVIIDGLLGITGWVDLNASQRSTLLAADPPYEGIDVAMITHNHGDHFSGQSISSYLSNNATVRVLAPPQVRNGLSGSPRIESNSPAFRTKEDVTVNGVDITIYHLRHFDQFGNDFSNVQNYGYLVRLGGLKILHLGDVEYSVANFQDFNLQDEGIDIVFLPTFNTLLSTQNRDIILDQINPGLVIGLHFQRARVASESSQVLGLYPNSDVFTTPLEFRRY